MALTFEELLSRAAEPTLQSLVGRRVVRLLGRIDPALTQPDRLRDIAIGLREPADMLLDSDTRAELVALLPLADAHSLAVRLGLPTDDPYEALRVVRIRRGSARASELLDFFSVGDVAENQAPATPTEESVLPVHALFSHQRTAARCVAQQLASEPNRVLLHMPTGSGKTRTAMAVICDFLERNEPFVVVWLAHSEELCEQAVEEFKSSWRVLGNREVRVTRWWGNHEYPDGGVSDGIIVAGLAKAYNSARRSLRDIGTIAGAAGLIVMDEAHQAIAPTYRLILDLFVHAGKTTPLLGLSATPGRTWNDINEDEHLAEFFSERKVSLEVPGFDSPIDYLVEKGYLAKVHFESMYHTSGIQLSNRDLATLAEGLDIPLRILNQLAEDEKRNLLIVNRVEQMMRRHARMLLFAATVEHALVLATVLRSRGAWAHAVTGTTAPAERARLINEFKRTSDESRILVNYGVLTAGFDAPRTSGAIIARPTTSLVLYSQMVGRATRGPLAGGNDDAEVVTVVDTNLPGFSSLAEAFHNWEDVWQ